MARVKKFTAWSYSRLRDYTECPFKAYLKYLEKIAEPPNPAMNRGSDIHTKAEEYIKGGIARLPKELKLFDSLFKDLCGRFKKKVHGMTVEETWAFTRDWNPTVWNDWAGCALRIKVDVAYPEDNALIVTDWKTGKNNSRFKDVYEEQIELCVIDDGVGFDISKMEEQSDGRQHIGVRNARIRFQKMCNGTVDIYSEKGKGTKIRINLPKGGQS